MPAKFDSCVKQVKKKIKIGDINKTYLDKGKRVKSNPYAICSKLNKPRRK